MKKNMLFVILLMAFGFLFAESGQILDNGSVFVIRNKGDFEDNIKISNRTDFTLTVSVKGTRKRSGKEEFLGNQRIEPGKTERLRTDFSGRMDLFSDFTFCFSEGSVSDFETSLERNDLYLCINKIFGKTEKDEDVASASKSEKPEEDIADKILKYKKLLDVGAISQQEFDTLKKQLLDF